MADAEFSGAAFLVQLDRDAYPHLAEHGDHHVKERAPSDEGEFAFGLDLIVDGLERLRQTA